MSCNPLASESAGKTVKDLEGFNGIKTYDLIIMQYVAASIDGCPALPKYIYGTEGDLQKIDGDILEDLNSDTMDTM